MPFRYYVEDFIYGASDGIITTFAVIAGVVGAGLSVKIVIIIGASSLLADGFSMAASDYLAHRSEEDVVANDGARKQTLSPFLTKSPIRSALVTFFTFVLAGLVPLLPYVFFGDVSNIFLYTLGAMGVTLFMVGALRTFATRRPWFLAGIEVVLVGGAAASIAYLVGQLISGIV